MTTSGTTQQQSVSQVMSGSIGLTENLVFVRVSFSLPGFTRQVGTSGAAEQLEAEEYRLRTSVKLFTGKAFQRIRTHDVGLRSRLLALALQMSGGWAGSYIIPRALLERLDVVLVEAKAYRAGLVENFVSEEYDAERERARTELGKAFNPADYPDYAEIRRQFGMGWSYFEMSIPTSLPGKIGQREAAKMKKQLEGIAADCRKALREGMVGLVQHLVERLEPDADGRRKRLSETTVANLVEFINLLAARDITSDVEIRALGEKAKAILGSATAGDLRDNRVMANRVREGLAKVAEKAVALAQVDGGRKFNFDE